MFGECHAHVIMDGINYKAAVAASICFLSARDSFFFVFTGCTVFSSVFPNIRCSHFFIAVNNVIHLLIEHFLPL